MGDSYNWRTRLCNLSNYVSSGEQHVIVEGFQLEVASSSAYNITTPLIMAEERKRNAEANFGDGVGDQVHKDGSNHNVAMDGALDFRGRAANKAIFGGWRAACVIMGSVVLERVAYYGIALNLVSYLVKELHEGTAQSIANVYNWIGVVWILPLLGGFLADAYLGRYWTIIGASLIYLAGMVLLTLSVTLKALKPPPCSTLTNCKNASPVQVGCFYLALYVVALGLGGVKPCISAFGADQFDERDEKERPMKRSFFNYWWVALAFAGAIALTALIYVQENVGFNWGYGIPTVGIAIFIGIFLSGTRKYRYKQPMGSPLTQVAQVLTAATRKYRVHVPSDPNLLHEVYESDQLNVLHTHHFRFLDRAATVAPTWRKNQKVGPDPNASSKSIAQELNYWKLCTVTQVEEVKLLIRVMPIWFATLTFMVVSAQSATTFLRQGISLDSHLGRHFKTPPASLELSASITSIIILPVYDRWIVPVVRRFTGNERGFSLLQRIGIGLVISIFSMGVAAMVEMKRLKVIRDNGLQHSIAPLPMSIFWLIPQYVILTLAQIFAYVGQLEFFYDQAPDNMKSMGTALFTANTGVGHFLCTALLNIITTVTSRGGHQSWVVSNINECRFDKYYWALTTLSALNFFAFVVVARWYTYKTTGRKPQCNSNEVPDCECPTPANS